MVKTYREQRLSDAEREAAAENCVQYAEMTEVDNDQEQIVVALTRQQSQMVRSLIYQEMCFENDPQQRDFLSTLVDQFEQVEGEDRT